MHRVTSPDILLKRGLKVSHLRLLSALADTGQITQAAAAVGVTQPAASRLMVEIERIIGSPVHERTGRGVGLTAVGEALARRARRVQMELDDAARDMAEIVAGGVGHVRIGTVTGPAMDRVLPALQADRAINPNVTVEVIVGPSDTLCDQLLSGRLDFAIGRLPEGPEKDMLSFVELETENVALLVRRGHPLLSGKVKAADVMSYDWVMPGADSILTRSVLARLAAHGLGKPTHRLSTASFLLTAAVVQHSDAIAPLSRAVANQFATSPEAPFAILPMDLGIDVEPYGLITRAGMSLTPTSQRLADMIGRAQAKPNRA